MSFSQVVQLYAPLLGLVLMAFWLGALSQRVKSLEDAEEQTRESAKELRETHDRIIRIETKLEGLAEDVGRMGRLIDGLQRQVANLMRPGAIQTFQGAGEQGSGP